MLLFAGSITKIAKIDKFIHLTVMLGKSNAGISN